MTVDTPVGPQEYLENFEAWLQTHQAHLQDRTAAGRSAVCRARMELSSANSTVEAFKKVDDDLADYLRQWEHAGQPAALETIKRARTTLTEQFKELAERNTTHLIAVTRDIWADALGENTLETVDWIIDAWGPAALELPLHQRVQILVDLLAWLIDVSEATRQGNVKRLRVLGLLTPWTRLGGLADLIGSHLKQTTAAARTNVLTTALRHATQSRTTRCRRYHRSRPTRDRCRTATPGGPRAP